MTMQGDELKALRKEMGHSQEQLGERLGLTGKFIGMMERGEAPIEARTEMALRWLAKALPEHLRPKRNPELQPLMDNLIRLRDEQLDYIASLRDTPLHRPDGSNASPSLIRTALMIANRLQLAINDGREIYGLDDTTEDDVAAMRSEIE